MLIQILQFLTLHNCQKLTQSKISKELIPGWLQYFPLICLKLSWLALFSSTLIHQQLVHYPASFCTLEQSMV